jgi:hypothetical protein
MSDFPSRLQRALGEAYVLERELTGGGMSRVFVATERALNRKVVVKVLPPDLAAGVNHDRFRREIQLAAQLQHPHIVPLLSAGEHGDLLYYTMPYVDGESLSTVIARRGGLGVREVQRILMDVAEALAYAHGRGVIHRDIKPGNILMQGAHALVADFGVAKALSAALPAAAGTTSGMVIGTPAYMAPEQLAADPAADHRVDIYSLGLVAWEALAGSSPFEGKSPRETMANQLTRVPPPLTTLNTGVPAGLAAVVSRCLQKDPEQRPATAELLVGELEEAAGTGGRRFGRHFWLARGVAALIAFMVLGVYLVVRQPTAPPDAAGRGANGAAPFAVDTVPDTVVVHEPAVLTRADSLAIAEALAPRRSALQQQGAPQAQIDSLRVQMERAVADSIGRLMAMLKERGMVGPTEPTWPRVTVQVSPDQPGRHPEGRIPVILFPVGTTLTGDAGTVQVLRAARDSLRAAIQAAGGFEVMGLENLQRAGSDGEAVARTLRGSFQVIGRLQRAGDGLVAMRLTIRAPGWPIGSRTVDLVSRPAPQTDPLATFGDLLPEVLRHLRGEGH